MVIGGRAAGRIPGSPFGKSAAKVGPRPTAEADEPMPSRAGDTAARGECRNSATRRRPHAPEQADSGSVQSMGGSCRVG